MSDESDITVEIIQCQSCAKLAVALNGSRITSHKCAGMWTSVFNERVPRHKVLECEAE